MNKKPELISPAGDLEKLKIAFQYGADAVYASTPKFSMRTREIGFDHEALKEGIDYAHSLSKRVYLTLNVFPHASEIEEIKKHALNTISLKPDAIIAADPGVILYLKENTDIPIHLSTQASTTNHLTANFWHKNGVERIVLARELNLKDIKIISQKSPIELESFVHGAMCMAYSGRCQISNYLVGRDPNKGGCVQPCRFKYKMHTVEEELRPDEHFPIYEDSQGFYIFNSKDLCMIQHIPDLINSGITSFKIEGRLKSIYYVAIATKTYRQAIDLYFQDPAKYEAEKDNLFSEIQKTSSRGFTTGFYYHKPNEDTNNYQSARTVSGWSFIGLVKNYDKNKKMAVVEVKNQLNNHQPAEIVTPEKIINYNLNTMIHNNTKVDVVHANYIIHIPLEEEIPQNSFLRIKHSK